MTASNNTIDAAPKLARLLHEEIMIEKFHWEYDMANSMRP